MTARMISVAVVAGDEVQNSSTALAAHAKWVGQLIAELGCNLITGGGQDGMAFVAQGFCETPYRMGQSIGAIPGIADGSPSSSPKSNCLNAWIEVPIFTHLSGEDAKGDRTTHIIMATSADIVVVLSEGKGTQAEEDLFLALPDKPVFVFVSDEEKIGELDVKALASTGRHVVTKFDTLRELLKTAVSVFSIKRPTFASLRSVYSSDSKSVHTCSIEFPYTCAIRMSEALDKVVPGIKDKFVASGKTLCPHNFVRGSQDLASILRQADVFGLYNVGFSKPNQVPDAVKGLKGIVVYMNIPNSGVQGHIDLWDADHPVGDAYWDADPIWFWKLT